MNTLDIILLLCFIPALIQGLRKGFISQVISIISIIAGIWASAKFADIVSAWTSQYLTASEQVLKVISFAIILILVFLILAIIGKAIEGIFKLVMLGWLNKLLGMVFALMKTFLIIGLLIIIFNSLNETFDFVKESTLDKSVLYPGMKKMAYEVFPYLKDLLTLTK